MDFLVVDSSLKDWAPKGEVRGSARLPTVCTNFTPLFDSAQLLAPLLLTIGSARWSCAKSDMTVGSMLAEGMSDCFSLLTMSLSTV